MRVQAWTPPDGLERSRPREVRLTLGGQLLIAGSLSLWLGALGALVGLHTVANRQAEERQAFREQSLEGAAEVTRLWRGSGEGKPRMVDYRLEVGGAHYSGRTRLATGAWSRLRVGDRMPVRYLPSNPSVSRLPGRERDGMPAFVPFLVGGGLALGAGVVLLPLRCQRRLLSEGRAAQARVTRHKKGQHGTEYEFEFTTLGGRSVKGKAGPGTKKAPAVGSTLCVLYDPDHPKSSAAYPFSLVTPRDKRSLLAPARRYSVAAAPSARSISAGLT